MVLISGARLRILRGGLTGVAGAVPRRRSYGCTSGSTSDAAGRSRAARARRRPRGGQIWRV